MIINNISGGNNQIATCINNNGVIDNNSNFSQGNCVEMLIGKLNALLIEIQRNEAYRSVIECNQEKSINLSLEGFIGQSVTAYLENLNKIRNAINGIKEIIENVIYISESLTASLSYLLILGNQIIAQLSII